MNNRKLHINMEHDIKLQNKHMRDHFLPIIFLSSEYFNTIEII